MRDFLKPFVRSAGWLQRHRSETKRPECSSTSCQGTRRLWERLLRPSTGSFLHGQFYCGPQCLAAALIGQMSRLHAMTPAPQPPNRIPLGLLMMARGKLTYAEVRAALEAQRRARYGTIGDWIEKLGFASEQDVTAALALQWGCPLASSSLDPAAVQFRGNIPLPILDAFQMIPFNYAVATNTLYLACGSRVDHAALYAIEKILQCRIQACVARAKSIRRQLELMQQLPHPSDVEFEACDLSEIARITSSYVARLSPEEVRLSRVGRFIWLWLSARSAVTNLLFCLRANPASRISSGPIYSRRQPTPERPVFGVRDQPFEREL
jgi:Type II secretion system (T2SS), protein E, N-terminal domain